MTTSISRWVQHTHLHFQTICGQTYRESHWHWWWCGRSQSNFCWHVCASVCGHVTFGPRVSSILDSFSFLWHKHAKNENSVWQSHVTDNQISLRKSWILWAYTHTHTAFDVETTSQTCHQAKMTSKLLPLLSLLIHFVQVSIIFCVCAVTLPLTGQWSKKNQIKEKLILIRFQFKFFH